MKILNIDVISHIFSGCSCDTQIHTQRGTGFQKNNNNATEIKLLVQSTLNLNSFVEITMTFCTKMKKNSVMLKKRNTWEVQNRDGSILDFEGKSKRSVSRCLRAEGTVTIFCQEGKFNARPGQGRGRVLNSNVVQRTISQPCPRSFGVPFPKVIF